jgi:hypothetical protein
MTDTVRLADLTLGSLCEIGLILSTAFWLPTSLLFGVAAVAGAAEVEWMGAPVSTAAALPVALLQGLAAALLSDAALAGGALVLTILRKFVRGPRLALRSAAGRRG